MSMSTTPGQDVTGAATAPGARPPAVPGRPAPTSEAVPPRTEATAVVRATPPPPVSGRRTLADRLLLTGDRGSQTMEYALLMIVAATVTALALTWARQGAIKTLLDSVLDKVLALFGIGKG
jgi:hypothetical protein